MGATEVAEPVVAMVEGAEVGPVEEVEATVAGTTAVEEWATTTHTIVEVAVTAATGTMEGAATVALADMGTGAMDAQAMLLARAGMFCLCSDFL